MGPELGQIAGELSWCSKLPELGARSDAYRLEGRSVPWWAGRSNVSVSSSSVQGLDGHLGAHYYSCQPQVLVQTR